MRNQPAEGIPWSSRTVSRLSLPLFRVFTWTLGAGVIVGLIAWALGHNLFGLGFFLGSLMALFSLYSLKALTTKVISAGDKKGLGYFHVMNIVRVIFMALICYLLLRISIACLLGAVSSYIWFLAVLGWFGVRHASPGMHPDAK
jgi:hypothetical protein